MNVEDILGYAQLKAGKFRKDIKRFNIQRAINEIIAIQSYQADSKGIVIATDFIGFTPRKEFENLYKPYSKKTPMKC